MDKGSPVSIAIVAIVAAVATTTTAAVVITPAPAKSFLLPCFHFMKCSAINNHGDKETPFVRVLINGVDVIFSNATVLKRRVKNTLNFAGEEPLLDLNKKILGSITLLV